MMECETKVLVLEDERRFRDHLKHHLERQGQSVFVAENAAEALRVIGESSIDLMIVDVRLPGGIDGLEVARRAIRQHGETQVIVITGYGSHECERRCRELGVIAYLEKPFDLDELDRQVQGALDRRDMLREIHRLAQALAAARDADTHGCVPIATITERGDVLRASAPAQAALDAVGDPRLPRPLRRVDRALLERLHQAATSPGVAGRTTLFRRDGVLSHFTAFAWSTRDGEQKTLTVFLAGEDRDSSGADELWFDILLRVAQARAPHTD